MTELEHAVEVVERFRAHTNEAITHIPNTHILFAAALRGSQNFNLDLPTSDIDSYTLVLPTPRQTVKTSTYTATFPLSSGETTITDYREMFRLFMKGNPAQLQILYTPHIYTNPEYMEFWTKLASYRDFIANCQPRVTMHSIAGMAHQSFDIALRNINNAPCGYDSKKMSRLIHYQYFANQFTTTCDMDDALHLDNNTIELIKEMRQNPPTLFEARRIGEDALATIDHLNHHNNLPDYNGYNEVSQFLNDLAFDIFVHILSKH